MTVLEVIQRSTGYLTERGVESPRLQIELILGHVLAMPRLKLYLDFNRGLTESELAQTRQLVKRRGQREPLQYILGSTSFCGLEVEVNRHVLIPRPETEALAERAWKLCGERGKQGGDGQGQASRLEIHDRQVGNLRNGRSEPCPTGEGVQAVGERVWVLDLCTGSGCLAVAIAAHCPNAMVHAVDVSRDALQVARRNAERHGLGERMQLFEGDLFAAAPPGTRYDMIVSNPPYIPTDDVRGLQPEVRDHEPMGALDGGADGLMIIRRIAAETPQFLAPGGWLLMEFSDGQGNACRELFSSEEWCEVGIEKDFSRRERILIARRKIS